MKKVLLTTSFLACIALGAKAQWNEQATNLDANVVVSDIKVVDPHNVWLVAQNLIPSGSTSAPAYQGGAITHDGGSTWTKFTIKFSGSTSYDCSNLAVVDANTCFVSMYKSTGGANAIVKTTDGGATWKKLNPTGVYTNSKSFLDVIHMFNAKEGVAIGDPINGAYEVYSTADSGATWTAVPNTGNQLAAVQGKEFGIVRLYDAVGDTIWFGSNSSDTANTDSTYIGKIFRSTDKGHTWTVAKTPFLRGLNHIQFTDAKHGIATDLNSTRLIATSDGGTTWSEITYTGNFYSFDITKVPGTYNKYWSCGLTSDRSAYTRSFTTDGGATWAPMANDADYAQNGFSKLDFLNDNFGYAGGYTSNGGGGAFIYDPNGVGIADIAGKSGIVVYPNPSNTGVFFVNTTTQSNIQVVDVTGKMVFNANEPAANNVKVDLSSMSKGLYLMKVTSGKTTSTHKLIVQ